MLLCRAARTDGTELLHCVRWVLPVTNPLKHKSELLGVPVLCGCGRKTQGKRLRKQGSSPSSYGTPPASIFHAAALRNLAARSGAWLLVLSQSRKALNSSPASCFRLGVKQKREALKLFLDGFPLKPLGCARTEVARRQSAEHGSVNESLEARALVSSSRGERSLPVRAMGTCWACPGRFGTCFCRGAGSQAVPRALARESRDQ